MKAVKGTDHRIHVEFAHFSNLKLFELIEKYAVRHADSLGMNEQELGLLLDYW
jgi:ADP-dependent phosphofructokinase/glucokinase